MTARKFVRRSPDDIREAAARLCERMAKADCGLVLSRHNARRSLIVAAKRIRRIPVAGRFKVGG